MENLVDTSVDNLKPLEMDSFAGKLIMKNETGRMIKMSFKKFEKYENFVHFSQKSHNDGVNEVNKEKMNEYAELSTMNVEL